MATAAALPATDKGRKILLAKVHIAKKDLHLDDDTYRGVLMRVAGVTSSASCTEAQLRLVVADFERRGFTSRAGKPGPSGRAPARADHAMARKARALWISLGYLCAIENHSEGALEAFAKRQLGCDKLQWANQSQSDRLIEGLKAMAERHGWDQSAKGLAKVDYIHMLWVRLCGAILAKLQRAGIAAEGWSLEDAAFRLCGLTVPRLKSTSEAQDVARALGAKLRAHGGRAAFAQIGAEVTP